MTRDDLEYALKDRNVQAFLRVIRAGETCQENKAYRMTFAGLLFESVKDHPRVTVTKGKLSSTAAGAYQFLQRTWDEIRLRYDLPDFSPHSQDLAAVGLLVRRGALNDVMEGKFHAAIRKCAPEWASLPGSPYEDQPQQTIAKALEVFTSYGGKVSEEVK